MTPLYLDRNVPRPLAEALREQGFTVVEATTVTADRTPDLEEMRESANRGAILVSLNYAERRAWARWAVRLSQEGMRPRILLLPAATFGPRLLLRVRMLLTYHQTLEEPPAIVLWNTLEQALIHGLQLERFSADDVARVLGRRPG